ncbi:amidase [Lentibacter sp. XHP0401]|uniref:amidase n=1 Tax=Lentibacter sp. XHP0401 TaxID=2984334 RepID=UPI0021E71459|nr:amidase family protein [Lentibacter sp. XHP0401]MCV2892482.1 amidase family protein [Lentibacter sp. XHP0401]
MTNWLTMSMADLGRGIAAGEIDPIDLTEEYLKAIKAHPFGTRIYARLTEKRARAEAKAASERASQGLRRGLLDGVPVSWKDLFDTAGTATEAGSALLESRVPDTDAWVLQNATKAGLVCLGKTHMSELAFSGLGLNPVTETPPCVNDESAVPGGSSSGAAASVAFGLAPCGVGSDTGGSVRIPSAWNDLVGLKTTSGRIPLTGAVPLAATFDTIGPLCRTVEDAALMLAVLEGSQAADLKGASIKGIRLAILETVAPDEVREAPKSAFESAVRHLKTAGAQIEHIKAPEVAEIMPLSGILFTSEAYGTWKDTIEAAPAKMFPEILGRFRSGKEFSAADYVAAWQTVEQARATWAKRVAGYDAVILPTAPILPPNAERLVTDSDYYITENLLALRNTRIGNLLGLPAITLPTGTPSCGISFMGAAFGEEKLLRVAAAAEKAMS